MKTILSKLVENTAVAILLFVVTLANAQSPIIQEFRNILADAPNKFESFKVDKLSENTEKNYQYYSSNIKELPFSTTRIVSKPNNEQSIYLIKYNVKNLDGMMLNIFTNISTQYMTEINDMVKSGKYTGRDLKDGTDGVTEILDLNGKHIVDYISNADDHYIYVYSTVKEIKENKVQTNDVIQVTHANMDEFKQLGSMAIYVGTTMYLVKIKGKSIGDVATVAARSAQVIGINSAYKYEWFLSQNCVTLKDKFGGNFNVVCTGEINLDK